MKAVIRGNDAKVYEMKRVRFDDITSFQSTIESKFLCRMNIPTMFLDKNDVMRRYRDDTVEWREW